MTLLSSGCVDGSNRDAEEEFVNWRTQMSNVCSESLSYKVPEMLIPCVLARSEVVVAQSDVSAELSGSRYVALGGGMSGDSGAGLGMWGANFETLSTP